MSTAVKNVIMIVTVLVAGGMLAWVLTSFFKKLNKLEHERWGDKAKSDTEASLGSTIKGLFKRSKKKQKQKQQAKVVAPAPKPVTIEQKKE